jgi:hypothetical protein
LFTLRLAQEQLRTLRLARCDMAQPFTVAGLPLKMAALLVCIFTVAFLLYIVCWTDAPLTEPDTGGYLRAAQDLADFHIDHLQERAPGYPLFLILTGSAQRPQRALFVVSLILHFTSIWLLASVLYSVGLRESMLVLFGLTLLLPPYVESAGYVLSENLTEVMLVISLVSFFFWIRNKKTVWLFVSAFAVAYAALTRPTYQILALTLAGYLLITNWLFGGGMMMWKQVMIGCLLIVGVSVIIVGGYAFANYRSVGYFGLSPKLGLTLSQKTLRVVERLPGSYGEVKDALIQVRNSELINGDSHTGYSYIWQAVPKLEKITGMQGQALSDYMLRLNLYLIHKAPLAYMQEVLWAFGSYWLPTTGELANFNSRFLQFVWASIQLLLIVAFAANLALLVSAGTYINRIAQRNSKTICNKFTLMRPQVIIYGFAAVIVFYTSAISCLLELPNARYRVPTDGLITFMLFLGVYLWNQLVGLGAMAVSSKSDPS